MLGGLSGYGWVSAAIQPGRLPAHLYRMRLRYLAKVESECAQVVGRSRSPNVARVFHQTG